MIALIGCTVLAPLSLVAQYVPGQTYWGANNFIEYRAGALPVIISAPHGGTIAPDSIPDRTCADCVTVRDANTLELAHVIDTMITQVFNCRPHVIVCHLHRRKLDANREIVNGAQGNPTAMQAWNEYHGFLASAKNTVLSQHSEGLLLDMHGHGHAIQRLELGYLLSGAELRLNDTVLALPPYPDDVSIRNLVDSNLTGQNLPQLLRGNAALGSLLQAAGYPAVPSDADPAPAENDPYFNGGYITAQYGSYNGGQLDAIQIECNFTGVRNNATNRRNFATALANQLHTYLSTHYFSGNIPCAIALSTETALHEFDLNCQDGLLTASWLTESRQEPVVVMVQKSMDGIDWTDIAPFRMSAGKSFFQTILPGYKVAGTTFFRLKIQESEGAFFYSPIKQATCQETVFQIWPNPNQGSFFIDPVPDQNQQLRVTDLLGRTVSFVENQGAVQIIGVPNGLYRIEILSENRLLWSTRICILE